MFSAYYVCNHHVVTYELQVFSIMGIQNTDFRLIKNN